MTRKLQDIARATKQPYADILELWQERAAIREYDGGIAREDAERLACDDVLRYYMEQA